MARELKFESPSFTQRIKGMLGVDFYRLFHTPMPLHSCASLRWG